RSDEDAGTVDRMRSASARNAVAWPGCARCRTRTVTLIALGCSRNAAAPSMAGARTAVKQRRTALANHCLADSDARDAARSEPCTTRIPRAVPGERGDIIAQPCAPLTSTGRAPGQRPRPGVQAHAERLGWRARAFPER